MALCQGQFLPHLKEGASVACSSFGRIPWVSRLDLASELLAIAHRRPSSERAPYLQTAGRSLALAERRGASPVTIQSQREWLQALTLEPRPGIAA